MRQFLTELRQFRNSLPTGQDTSLVWLGLLLFIILVIGVLLPLIPEDYWWYVRLGQEISRTGQIPQVDTFSSTQAGQPIVYHSWLSAVILWLMHHWGGLTLTVLGRAVLLAGLYGFVWQSCRFAGAGPRLASGVTLLAALASSYNWMMRPQTFSYPLFGLMVLLLWYQPGRLRWLLPLIMALWVNLHGAFILGFGLVGAVFLGGESDRKTTLVILGAMFLASLVTPRGFGAWTYVLTLLTDPSSQQLGTEWRPPTNEGWQGTLFFGWLLLFAPLAAMSPARLSLTHWLWFLIFGWMAMSGVRYVIWFTIILAPLTAHLLAPLIGHYTDSRLTTGLPTLNRAIVGLLFLLVIPLLPGLREQWWPDAPPVLSANTPVEATTWLAARPDLPGPLWSHISFSSYLIYALPERPVWSDTRLELYPLEQSERYLTISKAAPGWQDLLAEEQIRLLMIDRVMQANLFEAVQQSTEWQLAYEDNRVAIFSRRTNYQFVQ